MLKSWNEIAVEPSDILWNGIPHFNAKVKEPIEKGTMQGQNHQSHWRTISQISLSLLIRQIIRAAFHQNTLSQHWENTRNGVTGRASERRERYIGTSLQSPRNNIIVTIPIGRAISPQTINWTKYLRARELWHSEISTPLKFQSNPTTFFGGRIDLTLVKFSPYSGTAKHQVTPHRQDLYQDR